MNYRKSLEDRQTHCYRKEKVLDMRTTKKDEMVGKKGTTMGGN